MDKFCLLYHRWYHHVCHHGVLSNKIILPDQICTFKIVFHSAVPTYLHHMLTNKLHIDHETRLHLLEKNGRFSIVSHHLLFHLFA